MRTLTWQQRQASTLTINLDGGILKDSQGRIGYIASNRQFQFDGPPQAGAIYTSGFSVCGNGTLALGGSAIWYSCLSGSFSNLYDQSQGAQCSQIYIQAIGGGSSSAAVGGATDGQATASTRAASSAASGASTRAASQLSVIPASPVCKLD